MKTLHRKVSPSYSCEVVTYKDNKFKIVAENGNSYCHLDIYVFTQNGDLEEIANFKDFNNAKYVDYARDDERRLNDSVYNIKVAEDFIKAIY